MQAEADAQATVFKKVNCAPTGLGAGWIFQLVPFHRAARLPALEFPTAVHADADVQDTPFRLAPWDSLGVGWIRHRVPFQCSATAWEAPVAVMLDPTAVQADGAAHATPSRLLTAVPAGLGAGRIRQE